MLKDYGNLIHADIRNDEPVCIWTAGIIDGCLRIERTDFGEWERNPRHGTVEITYFFDIDNTTRLARLLRAETSEQLIDAIRCMMTNSRVSFATITPVTKFCKAHDIHYYYSVWY